MSPVRVIRSRTLVLPESNIDTDQIIPARFLSTTGSAGLDRAAFADWRFDEQGRERPECVLNEPASADARILVAGDNFGCGSSREHAVWALQQFGFQAVISSRLADIFTANALKNGLLAVTVDADSHAWLLDHPGARLTINVAAGAITIPGRPKVGFELDPFTRTCLLDGVDTMGYLLARQDAIAHFERHRQEAG